MLTVVWIFHGLVFLGVCNLMTPPHLAYCGYPLDPASYDLEHGSHLATKVGIDATRKANYKEEISVPWTDEIELDK